MLPTHGPSVPFSAELHAKKYRQSGESFRSAMNRIAAALTGPEEFPAFRQALLEMRFLPAGRIQAAVGSPRQVTPFNCYVSGTISDSFVDGPNSIMDMAKNAAATMRLGGGIGYDFSTLRPKGDLIHKLQSYSTGPVSFMHIYDAVCKCVASSGHRRGAQMGILRVDHPDILEFIRAKQPPPETQVLWDMVADMPEGPEKYAAISALQTTLKLTGFNLSVMVTDEFMEARAAGKAFDLRFGGKTYGQIDAGELWDELMRSTWDWAEPGVLYYDTINRMNNLWYCETIAATNPCAEQTLPPDGACLLGSFNLVKYLYKAGDHYAFDGELFQKDIALAVSALDRVIDKALYPLEAQKREALNKRRMGLGITGLANTAEALGFPYGSDAFLHFEANILRMLANESYRASAMLAKERGAFPLFDEEKYLKGVWINETLDADVIDLIRRYGIRNSHLTSIAPTGTISLCADNVSSGIEPVFSYGFDRIIWDEGVQRTERVEDYGVKFLGVRGKTAEQVTVKEHVAALNVAAKFVDSSVSKTCNIPSSTSWEDFKQVYIDAWEGGAKGCTTFRVGGKRSGVLVASEPKPEEQEGLSCSIDPLTGRSNCE